MGREARRGTIHWKWPLALALISLALNASFALIAGIPKPSFHDEFSYQLAGDTFAYGRLANPTHPFWEHFESIHIIHTPSYVSKYPPAQGALLALGQISTGIPLAGVWAATALTCALACWALTGWVARRWAIVGALILALHPLLLEWNQIYWGGVPALMGGVLLCGGAIRLGRRPRVFDSIVCAIGVGLLANSRPYEGLTITTLMGGMVLVLWARRGAWTIALKRGVLPFIAVMTPVMGWMAYYNHRTTGNPLLMPYIEHERQYGSAPLFVFQTPRAEPEYRHEAIREYHAAWSMETFRRQQTWQGYGAQTFAKFRRLAAEYSAWGTLVAGLAVLPWVFRWPRVRVAGILLLGFLIALAPAVWVLPHYAAPVFLLFLTLIAAGFEWLWHRPRKMPWAGRAIVVISMISLLVATGQRFRALSLRGSNPLSFVSSRARVSDHVATVAEKNLIFVTYDGPKLPHLEWVYNAAAIDHAPIVWARDLGQERNAKLMGHLGDHVAWRLIVRGPEVELRRY